MRNSETSNGTPFTRPWAIPSLLTSMTAAVTPRSRMVANIACRSVDSGVLRLLLMSWPAIRLTTVPIRPVAAPEARRPASIMKDVVVLPFVPVMPTHGEVGGWVAVHPGRDVAEHVPGPLGDEARGGAAAPGALGIGQHRNCAGGDGLRR